MRISHGALLNMVGHGAPLVAALVTVPALLSALGAERFGFLALAWAVVGAFSMFDFGLSRALSRLVAERRGTVRESGLPQLSGTALTLTLGFGLAAGLLLYVSAAWICARLAQLPAAMVEEAVLALRALATCLPFVTLTAALRGLLEGYRFFGWLNAIRIPLNVLMLAAPLAVVSTPTPLLAVCGVLALLRFLGVIAHWAICWNLMRPLTKLAVPRGEAIKEMFAYGAWVTVSSTLGPLMDYADRFVISVLVSLAAVGYYTAPYEVLTRLWIVPAALTGALFPALAAASPKQARALQWKGVVVMFSTAVPLALIAAWTAPLWISIWLGAVFAEQTVEVARWLAFGVAANCVAHVPFALLQARGRADTTGMLHLAELPFYFALLWLLTETYGIRGAAIAWSVRTAVDAVMLFTLARRHLRRRLR